MITIEITAAVDAAGTLKTFYLSDERFVTSPTDTPANTAFNDVLIDPGSLGINAYRQGATSGATRLETGEIVINNADGELDAWLDYGFDGRPVIIRKDDGIDHGAYPASFAVVLTATVESIEATFEQLVVRIRDKQYLFQVTALPNRYLGDNVAPNGLEGTANDIKGQVKPRVFGSVFNVEPVLVNASKLTYQVSDAALNDISAVYDRGVSLTKGADYADAATLQALTGLTGGTYYTCNAAGLFRLGGASAGQVTVDAQQGSTASDRTVGQILKSLALLAGVPSGDIVGSDVTALDASSSAVIGLFLNDDSTFQTALDDVASSIGATFGFDSLGRFRMGRLTEPSGTPIISLADYDFDEDIERLPATDNNVPVYAVTVNHTKLGVVQTTDIAGSVSMDRRAFLSKEYRSERAVDATIKNKYLMASEITTNTLLVSSADAAAEAARQLALYGKRRDVIQLTVPSEIVTGSSVDMLSVVSLTVDRFGLGSGKSFRVIGLRVGLTEDSVTLTLWG